jgi:hypothetical protein
MGSVRFSVTSLGAKAETKSGRFQILFGTEDWIEIILGVGK